MPSIILVNCLWQSPISIIIPKFPCLAVGAPHLHCVFQMRSDKNGIRTSGFLDTTFLMIQDVICFAFPIIPRICSSHQRVSPAETTTPRSLSFSTTWKGVWPIIMIMCMTHHARAYGQVFVRLWRFVGFSSSLLWGRVLKSNDFGLE